MNPTLYEGAPFKPTFDRLGLTWMPYANWGEVQGPGDPLAHGPGSNAHALARSHAMYLHSLPEGVPWFIDMGGWSLLRSILPARGAVVADVCRGLDSGVFPCNGDVERMAPYFAALRAFGIKPEQVGFYFDDGDEFSLFQQTWLDVAEPFKDVRDIYMGGTNLTPAEVDRRFHQAMVNTHKATLAVLGFGPELVVVAGCSAIDMNQGPAIDTPISHMWAGDWPGATAAIWEQAWAIRSGWVNQLTKLGLKSWVHLSATMPPVQAARGAALGATYNAVFCGGDPVALDPKIAAVSAAINGGAAS